MFLFLPFRAKNPPIQFPWVTVGLIIVNIVIYVLTTKSLLVVNEAALEMYGFSHTHLTPIRLITHLFLHANLLHLLGNMLFLWVFGGAVEGRIGSIFFLPMYLIAGMVAGLAQDSVNGRLYPDMWCIGASGAIMSLLGAYLWLSPHAQILVAYVIGFGVRLHYGIMTWEARWLVLGYAVSDLVQGYFFRNIGGGGTANFAHLGGMLAGYLIARLSQMSQESAQFSESQAIRSDFGGNYEIMQFRELEPLVNGPQPTIDAIYHFANRALEQADGPQLATNALTKHAAMILEKGNPQRFAELLLSYPQYPNTPMPLALLYGIAEILEKNSWFEMAGKLYKRAAAMTIMTPAGEVPLLRLGRLLEKTNQDKRLAAAIYQESLRLYPEGTHTILIQQALRRLPEPTKYYSLRSGQFVDSPDPLPQTAKTAPSTAPNPLLSPPVRPAQSFVGLNGIMATASRNAKTVEPEPEPDWEEPAPTLQLVPEDDTMIMPGVAPSMRKGK